MMKKIKRLLALALSVAMVISLVACGSPDTTKTTEADRKTDAPTQGSTTGSEEATQAPTVEEETGIKYPLDTDIKVSLWTAILDLNSDYNDFSESPYHTGLSKNTGVEIEWRAPMTGQNSTDAYNLLWTEKVLPDVIYHKQSLKKVGQLYDDGLIWDLTPYIEQYAPDYWAALQKSETLYKSATTSDGKILAFFALRETEWGAVSYGPQVRKDWLDEQKLEAPVTLADWENVLTVFKEKYNATLGFASAMLKSVFFAPGAGCYNTGSNGGDGVFFKDDNGEIQCTYLTPEWKTYMETLRRWYKNGLIDVDSLTMNAAAVRTKAANNQIGASYGVMSQLTNFNTDAEKNNTGAVWTGAVNLRTEEGKPPFNIRGAGGGVTGSSAVITKSCSEEKLIEVIKFLNYGYTEEGFMYNNFGTLGDTYTLDANGVPQWTDKVANDPQGQNALTKYTGSSSLPLGIQADQFLKLKNHPLTAEAVDLWIKDFDTENNHKFYTAELTEEESLIYTNRMANIDTYVNEMVQKFILGTESLDNIDAFYKQLETLGINECLYVTRAAYARYEAR